MHWVPIFIGNNKSTYFGQSFCPSSGASQPYNGTGTVYAARWPSATRIRAELEVVQLRSSWWWAERLPETCRVIITHKNWNSVHMLVLFTRNLSRCRSYNPKISLEFNSLLHTIGPGIDADSSLNLIKCLTC
jgi:hypothetical protein